MICEIVNDDGTMARLPDLADADPLDTIDRLFICA
jgi:3,4-dihydroxy-2-butanone 4-phosphate synthase